MLPIYDKVLQKSHSMKYKNKFKLEGPLMILAWPKSLLKVASLRAGCAGSCSIQFWYLPEKRYALSSNDCFLFPLKEVQILANHF